MAAKAAAEALASANLVAADVDLVLWASGTPDQPVPGGGALLHRALGLSGVPAFAVHATCLGFLVGLRTAALYMAGGAVRARRLRRGSGGLNLAEPESACLMGDGAAAAVVTATPAGEASAFEAVRFKTFSEGADLTAFRGGGSPPTRSRTATPTSSSRWTAPLCSG